MFSNHAVEAIHNQFGNLIVRTPCIYSPYLSELTKSRVYLKLENMQKTGSFKERGVLSFLLHHKDKQINHVVTASAGNHAQAVALHAARLSIPATIFMPIGTTNTKVAETERLLAKVELIGETYDEAYASAQAFSESFCVPYVHAYNDFHVILGQATVALEICSQVGMPDVVFVPVGGGGLIAGIARFFANCGDVTPEIIGVEAQSYQSMAEALNKGKKDTFPVVKTIAEGIAVQKVGNLTKNICQELNPSFIAVSDEQIQSAIILLLERQKTLVEGAGAASVAALLSEKFRHNFNNKTVVLIISGGNIDISLLARLTAQELARSSRLSRMSIVIKDSPGSLSLLFANNY